MNLPPLLWGLAAGLAVGIVIVWLHFRLKTAQKISQAVQSYQSQLAVLGERLAGREADIQGWQAQHREVAEENGRLRQTLLQEGQEKAAAMKEGEQLTELRGRLLDREKDKP